MHSRPALALALTALALTAASDRRYYGNKPGYLPETFDVRAVIEPAPSDGDARDAADRRIFQETRAKIGTPRYRLATADVDGDEAAMGRDFSCAAGITLTPQSAPRTFATIERASLDTGRATADAKDFFKRPRPFLVASGEICQPRRELEGSYDYPSGHTTHGWTWGYVLAELLPDRAPAIFERARAYGDSRYICGAHNFSAVVGGQASASATMAAVRTTQAYRTDIEAARREIAMLVARNAAKPEGCDAERQLIETRVP